MRNNISTICGPRLIREQVLSGKWKRRAIGGECPAKGTSGSSRRISDRIPWNGCVPSILIIVLPDLLLTFILNTEDVVVAAEELRYAANAVGKVTGAIGVEEVLDVVFREFCIGK